MPNANKRKIAETSGDAHGRRKAPAEEGRNERSDALPQRNLAGKTLPAQAPAGEVTKKNCKRKRKPPA